MAHGPSVDWGKDNAIKHKTKIGLMLFFVYFVIYAGFVGINALKPKLMEQEILFGLNLACVYGFGLIIFAIVLGMIYNAICTRAENVMNNKEGDESWFIKSLLLR